MQCNKNNGSKKLLVFAGTTEGREFFSAALRRGFFVCSSVASQYGAEELKKEIPKEDAFRAKIHIGRLDEEQMRLFFKKENFFAVVDATHPYATEASENIFFACKKEKIAYFRLKRKVSFSLSDLPKNSKEFLSIEEMCNFLADTREECYSEGNIFVSTGSKNIESFLKIPNFFSRAWIRVLPYEKSIEKCVRLGFSRNRIIAMQGPFSEALNEAFFREFNIKILITKQSGEEGGFLEKLLAAKKCSIAVLMIKAPEEKSGRVFLSEEIFCALEKLLSF